MIRSQIFFCRLNGVSYYFELTEIVHEKVAKDLGDQQKTKGDVSEGAFYTEADPLLRILLNKVAKKYETDGFDIDLVLYYERQFPINPEATLKANESVVVNALLPSGPFSRIWIYDSWKKSILWKRPA